MSGGIDPGALAGLIAGGELDRKMIDELARADRAQMRKLLETFLPAPEVDAMLARIDALIAAAAKK